MAKPARKSPILGTVASLIGEASGRLVTAEAKFRHSFEVEIALVDADPDQARRIFQPEELAGLAATLQAQGQLQPILIRRSPTDRRRWVIVAGERRWRAAQLLGWSHLLAIEHVGDADVVSLIENLQRVDLSAVEEARGMQRLIRDKGWSQDQLAAALGKGKSEISASMRILTLPEEVLDRVLTSELVVPKNVLVEIARVEDPRQREKLIEMALQGGLTVRGIRDAKPEPATAAAPDDASEIEIAHRTLRKLTRIVHETALARRDLPEELRRDLAQLRDAIDQFLRFNA
jgi:ParB family transcriptional regulator, chromosome partitioning protein